MIRNVLADALRKRQVQFPEPEPVHIAPAPAPELKVVKKEAPAEKVELPDDLENLTLDDAVKMLNEEEQEEQEFHDHSELLVLLDAVLAKSSETWGRFIIEDWDTSNLEEVRNGLLLCRSLLAQDPKVKLDE